MPTALPFDGGESNPGFHDEIDFLTSLAPMIDLALAGARGICPVRSDRRLDEPPAQFPVSACPSPD